MTLTFTSYVVLDDPALAIRFHFVSPDPGPGQPNDYFVTLTQTELDGIATQLQLRNALQGKLERKLRANGIASKLDPLIGQSLVIA